MIETVICKLKYLLKLINKLFFKEKENNKLNLKQSKIKDLMGYLNVCKTSNIY